MNNHLDVNFKSDNTDNDWGEIVDQNIYCDKQISDSGLPNYNSHDKITNVPNVPNAPNMHSNDKDIAIKTFDHVDIEDVKSLDIKSMSDLILLEKSSSIVKNLKFQFIKRCNDDQDKFMIWVITSLIWLNTVMKELARRNKQSFEISNSIDKDIKKSISRTSYKFCEFGYNCKFNYNIKEKCYAHHFVFNYISLDIASVIDFIIEDYDIIKLRQITDANDLSEIKTSINTITYVINHMYDELLQLKNINHPYYENYEKRIYTFRTMHGKKRVRKDLQ